LQGLCHALTFKEGSEFFNRVYNTTACSADEDFDAPIGTVTLTKKADMGDLHGKLEAWKDFARVSSPNTLGV